MSKLNILTNEQVDSFNENGFVIFKSEDTKKLRKTIISDVKQLTIRLLSHIRNENEIKAVSGSDFSNIFDWCLNHDETDNITRMLYEMYPSSLELIGLLTNPLLINLAKDVGISYPIPSTIPTIRVDRPKNTKYLTDIHQDIWYSLQSTNSIVFWSHLVSLNEDMGYLRVVPGSHKDGVLPFYKKEDGYTFTLKKDYKEDNFIKVKLADDEILIFSQNLVHKSAHNNGDRARVTLQIRYNDIATLKEVTPTFTCVHSKYLVEKQSLLLKKYSS